MSTEYVEYHNLAETNICAIDRDGWVELFITLNDCQLAGSMFAVAEDLDAAQLRQLAKELTEIANSMEPASPDPVTAHNED